MTLEEWTVAALDDERRRSIVRYFLEADTDDATIGELAGHIAGATPESTGDREQVLVELHHVHLPKLDDCGVLEFDPRSGAVRYDGNPLAEDLVRSFDSVPAW